MLRYLRALFTFDYFLLYLQRDAQKARVTIFHEFTLSFDGLSSWSEFEETNSISQ